MKFVTTNTRVLMLTLVIASVGGTLAITQILNVDNVSTSNQQQGGALLTGNVKVTQFDGDGNVIAYRQSDNHIVRRGMEIIMSQLFGAANGVGTCCNGSYPGGVVDTTTHPVRFMQIGTNGERRLLSNDTSIMAPVTPVTCLRQLASVSNSSAQGAHDAPVACSAPNCSAQMNVTATASFSGASCSGPSTIDEAGIFDNSTTDTVGQEPGPSTNSGYMFARNTFGSVILNALDTLQLDWEFTFTDS